MYQKSPIKMASTDIFYDKPSPFRIELTKSTDKMAIDKNKSFKASCSSAGVEEFRIKNPFGAETQDGNKPQSIYLPRC